MLNWIVWKGTVFYAKLNSLKDNCFDIYWCKQTTSLILNWIVWNSIVWLNWIVWNRNVFDN